MTPTAVVRPLPGPGLVARSGDLLLVCADGAPGVEELLGLVAEVASAGGDGSTLVRRAAALLAADFTGRYPACALCGPAGDDRLAVLVHGSALATVVGADGEVRLSAADAITSVNRLVSGPISSVRLELPEAGSASPHARLEAGVITAAGVVSGDLAEHPAAAMDPMRAPAQSPAPRIESVAPGPIESDGPTPDQTWSASSVVDRDVAPDWPPVQPPPVPVPFTMDPPPEPPSFTRESASAAFESATEVEPASYEQASYAPSGYESAAFEAIAHHNAAYETPVYEPPAVPVPLYEAPPPDAPSLREPTDGSPFVSVAVGAGEAPPAPSAPAADGRPIVLGLMCPNGHLTDPGAESCLTCGVSLVGRPPELREGPRPPMGALLLDDGSTYVLDVDYLLGREPQTDPEVIAGMLRPLKIVDAEGVVSRKHVRIALVGWDIQVIDLGSANGTFVQYPGEMQNHQLLAHHPVVVRPGTQVTMGRRWFRVEALAQG